MGRGIIESSLFRTERVELEQRTSDPSSPAPGEEWLRVDQKPTVEDADGNTINCVAEYRVANADGSIDTAPVPSWTVDSGPNVIDKTRVEVTAGGAPSGTGYIPYATTGAAYPNRKLEHPTDGRVALHDALTAGAVLPDSGVSRWQFDEGSGSTVADSIGSADGTINGPSWTSGTWVGGWALDGDGSDDVVETTPLDAFCQQIDTDLAVAYTIQTTSTSSMQYMGSQEISVRATSGFRESDGNVDFSIDDANGNTVEVSTGAGVINDGNPHRVVLNKTSNTASGFEIHVDTTQESTSTYNDDGISATGTATHDFPFFARRLSDGGLDRYADVLLDDIIFFDDSLSSQQITDDFDRQPWS